MRKLSFSPRPSPRSPPTNPYAKVDHHVAGIEASSLDDAMARLERVSPCPTSSSAASPDGRSRRLRIIVTCQPPPLA